MIFKLKLNGIIRLFADDAALVYNGGNQQDVRSWKTHISETSRQIAPFVGLLRRVRHVASRKILINIYYAHIHLRYLPPSMGIRKPERNKKTGSSPEQSDEIHLF